MGEVREQRYVCKICNKSCVSGKSLGGHMRVHLAQIAASKKAAQEIKSELKMEFEGVDDEESSKNQSNGEEKMKNNCGSNTDFGDGDQNSNYGLRENPKKSWRIDSDTKHGDLKKGASCKECSKEFPSLRALSGHMRCHSIKNREIHQCKKCGKEFGSMRAMFGHMKSHSKKLRAPDESAESLSDFENVCPIRRKRSRIRYKSALKESNSVVSELEEVEEAASCLMMLSRGATDWLKLDSVAETSEDCSVYFGAESCMSKKFCENHGDFVCDTDNKAVKTSLLTEKLDCCTSDYANAYTDQPEFDNLDSKFVVEDEMRVDLEVVGDKVLVVGNKMKADFQVSAELDKDLLSASENEANPEILIDFEKKKQLEYKCRSHDKSIISHRVLFGHNAKHKLQGNSLVSLSVTEADSKRDQLECSENDNQLEQESTGVGIVSLESSKIKEHECPICFKVFPSGQALGGHKRAHYTGLAESKIQEAMAVNQEEVLVDEVHDVFDLNFPVDVDEGTKTNAGNNLWWVERSHEHEALVLTN